MIKPWTGIRAFYEDLLNKGMPVHGMVKLIEEIELSRYASGIYGETSLHDLRIVQFAEANLAHDAHLRISPRFDGTMEFRYVDTHIKDRQWLRVVKNDDAFPRLAGFLHQLHWFSGDPPDPQ